MPLPTGPQGDPTERPEQDSAEQDFAEAQARLRDTPPHLRGLRERIEAQLARTEAPEQQEEERDVS